VCRLEIAGRFIALCDCVIVELDRAPRFALGLPGHRFRFASREEDVEVRREDLAEFECRPSAKPES